MLTSITLKALRQTPATQTFYYTLSILTLGLLPIILRAYPHLRTHFFLKSKLKNCTHLNLIYHQKESKNTEIIKIKKIRINDHQKLIKRIVRNGCVKMAIINFVRYFYCYEECRFVSSMEIIKNIQINHFLNDDIHAHKRQNYINKININAHDENLHSHLKSIINTQLPTFLNALLHGPNTTSPPTPSTTHIIIQNVFSTFSIYIYICTFIWSQINYYFYAILLLLIALHTMIVDIYEGLRNKYNIEKISGAETEKNKERKKDNQRDHKKDNQRDHKKNNKEHSIDLNDNQSVHLLQFLNNSFSIRSTTNSNTFPNDIILIKNGELHSDIQLLNCNCLIDESFLTGESVLVEKREGDIIRAGTIVREVYLSNEMNNQIDDTQLSGTEKESTHQSGNNPQLSNPDLFSILSMPWGKIINTSFNTTKGTLIRSLLIKRPSSSKLISNGYRIILLSLIAGTFLSTLVFFYSIFTISVKEAFLYSIDLIITIITPALPATTWIGIISSIRRLKKKNVVCNDSKRITDVSYIENIIFDKTGTLTEEGLDVVEVYVTEERENDIVKEDDKSIMKQKEGDLKHPYDSTSNKEDLFNLAISSCHTLKYRNNQLNGDPLDIKMFNYSQSRIINDCTILLHNNKQVKIIHTIPFNSEIRKQYSFISYDNKKYLFVKGSPESIYELVSEQEAFYYEKVRGYAIKGYRVIALAYKEIQAEEEKNLNDNNFIFLGFIIFANKLKKESKKIIKTLKNEQFNIFMATGDNILTAVSVGKEVGMVKGVVVIPYVEKDMIEWYVIKDDSCEEKKDEEYHKEYDKEYHNEYHKEFNNDSTDTPFDNDNIYFDPIRLKCFSNQTQIDYTIALEGKEFNYFFKNSLLIDQLKEIKEIIKSKCKIYGRMKPDQKRMLCKNIKCVFVGDGANDVEALQECEIGLSLSNLVEEKESEENKKGKQKEKEIQEDKIKEKGIQEIEVEKMNQQNNQINPKETNTHNLNSSFISTNNDLHSILYLIHYGRQSLQISYNTFKFTLYTSLIQFTSFCLMTVFRVFIHEMGTLYYDVVIVLGVSVVFRMEDKERDNKKETDYKKEQSITHKSFFNYDKYNITGQSFIISFIGHLLIDTLFMVLLSLFIPKDNPSSEIVHLSSFSTCIFFMTAVQAITMGIIINKKINWVFMTEIVLLCIVLGWYVLGDERVFRFKWVGWWLFGLFGGCVAVNVGCKFVFEWIVEKRLE